MKHGWENESRVPAYDPRDDDEEEDPAPENPAAILMRRLIGMMLADTNPALGIECMALVTGIGYDGSSMSRIADRHGCTRATVSARCVDLCDALGLQPVRAMRPLKNRERCREARAREHVAA